MTANILLTFYAVITLWFMQSIGVNRTMRNIVAISLGAMIGSLWL